MKRTIEVWTGGREVRWERLGLGCAMSFSWHKRNNFCTVPYGEISQCTHPNFLRNMMLATNLPCHILYRLRSMANK